MGKQKHVKLPTLPVRKTGFIPFGRKTWKIRICSLYSQISRVALFKLLGYKVNKHAGLDLGVEA
jgi:hypothetical protein